MIMKMKIFKKLFFACGTMAFLAGCSLTEDPKDFTFVNTSNYFNTEADAIGSLDYAYDILTANEYYGRGMTWVGSAPTEELTFKSGAGPDDKALDNWTFTANQLSVSNLYSNAFIGINRANTVLHFVPGIKGMSEASMNEVLGEAYFLRALGYFNLVRIFGEVPLRDSPVLTDQNLSIAKSSIQDIYALIEADLLKAETMTDQTPRDGANQIGVWSLLSKVYLHMASSKASGSPGYDFVSDADAYYAKASTYAGKVVNNSVYTFWTGDVKELWDVDNQSGNEFIYSVTFHAAGGVTEGDFSKMAWLFVPYFGDPMTIGPDFSWTLPSGAFGHLNTETAFYNSFSSSDNRKTDLIVDDVIINSKHFTFNNPDPNFQLPYPFSRKYIDKNQAGDQSSHYIPVLRFSDIALVYAEAEGPTANGYTWINNIRSRAGLPDLTPLLGVQAFRDSVVRERSFELAFEGQRLFDLRRTKTVESVLHDKYGKTLNANTYFFDTPQLEKDLNDLID